MQLIVKSERFREEIKMTTKDLEYKEGEDYREIDGIVLDEEPKAIF